MEVLFFYICVGEERGGGRGGGKRKRKNREGEELGLICRYYVGCMNIGIYWGASAFDGMER